MNSKMSEIKPTDFNIDPQLLIKKCEDEQLHLSGAIQNYGGLIAIDPISHLITHVSSNIETYVQKTPNQLLGQSPNLLSWFNSSQIIQTLINEPKFKFNFKNIESSSDFQVNASLFLGATHIIVELEKIPKFDDIFLTRDFFSHLKISNKDDPDFQKRNVILVESIREITGFDRVMLYRFHEDWTGEVIAESKREGMGSYFGLRFPASDIPAQARALYLVNPFRMIPDAKSSQIPIVGLDPHPPDLSKTDLRSVSPVHLQYLDNMGVEASFSLPIRFTDKLWGLVACHNLSAKLLSPSQRTHCINISRNHAMALFNFLAGQKMQSIDSIDRNIKILFEKLTSQQNLNEGLKDIASELLEIMKSQGFAIVTSEETSSIGNSPDFQEIAEIDHWFLKSTVDNIFSTDHLIEIFPNASFLKKTSGMMAIKITENEKKNNSVRMYWFRSEQLQEVDWAGNPDKPLMEKDGVLILSPRRSFDKWTEVKKNQSRPWTNENKLYATKFRLALYEWFWNKE